MAPRDAPQRRLQAGAVHGETEGARLVEVSGRTEAAVEEGVPDGRHRLRRVDVGAQACRHARSRSTCVASMRGKNMTQNPLLLIKKKKIIITPSYRTKDVSCDNRGNTRRHDQHARRRRAAHMRVTRALLSFNRYTKFWDLSAKKILRITPWLRL